MAARGALIGWLSQRWAGQLGDGQPAKELSLAPEPRTLPAGSPAACVPERLSDQVRPGPPRRNGPAFCSHLCGHMGVGPGAFLERNPCVWVSAPVSGSYSCSQAGSGSRGRGGGQVLACASPLMPRPGAQIPASGGGRETPGPSTRPGPRLLRRAGQPEPGREREARPDSGFATCPGAPHPETQDLQVLLPQIQAFRLQPSSLRPGSPNLSSPPSEPGVQTLALILQFQGPEARPSLPQMQNPGFIPPPPNRKVQTSSPSKPKFWTLAYLTQTQVLDFLEAEESRPQPYYLRHRVGLISLFCPQVFVTWSWWC